MKKIVIIKKDCDNWKILWLKDSCSNIICSNINEVIRAASNFLFLFYEKISHGQKAQKAQKTQKALKAPKALKGTKTLWEKHKMQISK